MPNNWLQSILLLLIGTSITLRMILGKWQSKKVTVKKQNVKYKFRLCRGLIAPLLVLIRPLTTNGEALEFTEIPEIPDTDTDDLLRMASMEARANVPEGVKHESVGRTLRGCGSVCCSRTLRTMGATEGMFCPASEPLATELNL